MNYSDYEIKVNKVPRIKELNNGKKEVIWEIILKEEISEKINLEDISQKLSHEDFDVKVKAEQGKYLAVCVTTIRDPNPYAHDYSMFDINRMFEEIEQLLGSIDTIQGQKVEDRWNPYKKSKKTENG
jgi:hypothetical protein